MLSSTRSLLGLIFLLTRNEGQYQGGVAPLDGLQSLCPDRQPGQYALLSSHPAYKSSQGCSCHHSQGGLKHSTPVSAEVGRGHTGQHGNGYGQGEENRDGCVDGHNLTELGKRHNDTEEQRDCGDCCSDGAGHYGNAHMVHCLQSSPLPCQRRRILQGKGEWKKKSVSCLI